MANHFPEKELTSHSNSICKGLYVPRVSFVPLVVEVFFFSSGTLIRR